MSETDVTEALETHLAAGRAKWRTAMHEVLGTTPPARSEWTDLEMMPAVLSPFMGEGIGHTYLPTGGGMDMRSARLGNERGTLDLRAGERATYRFRPTKLIIHYFTEAPAQSFVFIEGGTLKQTAVYDYGIDDMEELVELSPGELRPRHVWDQGYVDHDEHGYEVPLPEKARLLLRYRRGSFLIVGYGSIWNGSSQTYDGEHDRLGADELRGLIQRAIEHRGLTE